MHDGRRIAIRLLLLGAMLVTTACVSAPPHRPLARADGEPPRIIPPPRGKRPPLAQRDYKALPQGARGRLPARDGDPIVVVLTPIARRDVTAESVRDEIIAPILKATGFKAGPTALRMPPSAGIVLPAASFAPLAQAVAFDYAAHPRLHAPETRNMLDVFLGRRAVDEKVDRALRIGEGMTFEQFKAGIERRERVFPFVQVHRGVPIEHVLLLATAWDEETVRSVQGSLLHDFSVDNSVALDPDAAVTAARRALASLGIESAKTHRTLDPPQLVLLPYGSDARGGAALRYAYRMQIEAAWRTRAGPFLLWADAATGAILALEPMLKTVVASGRTFPRDPGAAGSVAVSFAVDPPSSGQYVLKSTGIAHQLDLDGGTNLAIGEATNGSSSTLANFDQSPHNDPAAALCDQGVLGGNKTFQQVDLFATLMRQRATILGSGVFTPFPRLQWFPTIVPMTTSCNADLSMAFGACNGYRHDACPNFSDGTADQGNLLSFAHDHSVAGHEVGHVATARATQDRPALWCAPAPGQTCTLPLGWGQFHDLADFWGAHLESTNCIGGWVAKNLNGVNASLNCAQHDESDWFPRLLSVTAGSVGGDHFPEHRANGANISYYADGQIAGAALWEVRAGMRSKCRPSGVPQFGVRFQRALMHAGFFDSQEPGSSDLGTYQRLHELLFKLVEQWAIAGSPTGAPAFAHNGAHTTNKVTAGFARAGLFLVFPACLDADSANDGDCPTTSPGADAVIDVDDADPDDDDVVNGVTVVDRDYVRLGGPAPVFHVWTGPRYRLDGASGAATVPATAPCNAQFRVEVSTDPTFTTTTAASSWTTVNRNPATPNTQCYGTWSPGPADWAALQAGGASSLIYYRARTQDAAGGTERVSTQPANGLWTVPPPYAVITTSGRADY